MAVKHYNLARMTTPTTGTGIITLGSAATGFLSFSAAGVRDGEKLSYAIEDGSNREVGWGVYTAVGTTLSRNVRASTNGGQPINLTGNAQVFCTIAAEDIPTSSIHGTPVEASPPIAKYWRLANLRSASSNCSIAELSLNSTVGGSRVTATPTITASSHWSGMLPANVWDTNVADANHWWAGDGSQAMGSEWLQLVFDSAICPREVTVTARNDAYVAQTVLSFDILYSFNGTTWVFHQSVQFDTWTSGAVQSRTIKDFDVDNATLMLSQLSDVDLVTTPPGNGQLLQFKTATKTWVPGTFVAVPPGGNAGQVLAKNTTTDYDMSWQSVTGGGGGGGGGSSLVSVGIPDVPAIGSVAVYALYSVTPPVVSPTNRTLSGLQASASTVYNTTSPYDLVNGNPQGAVVGWLTTKVSTGWVQYVLPTAVVVTSYAIMGWSIDTFPARCPTAWTLQGSNNGVDWTDLDTRSNQTSWTIWTANTYEVTGNLTAFTTYRLVITANNGNSYLGLSQFVLFTAADPAVGCAPCLVTASSYYSDATRPAQVFRADPKSSSASWLTAATATGWLQVKLSAAVAVTHYMLAAYSPDNFPARSPVAWTLQGSNNGTDWTILDTRVDQTDWTIWSPNIYRFSNTTAYTYYKIDVTANNGNSYMGLSMFRLLTSTPIAGNQPVLFVVDQYGVHHQLAVLGK